MQTTPANSWRSYHSSLLPHQMSQYWAIYAPAADLGRGGHISGPLSGIEPQFPVTRYCHPGPLNHDQRLIGQKFVRSCRTPEGAHPARAKSHVWQVSLDHHFTLILTIDSVCFGLPHSTSHARKPRRGREPKRMRTRVHVLAIWLRRVSDMKRIHMDIGKMIAGAMSHSQTN